MELTRRLHITTLYVTHDQLEALAMSDVVAIMRKGQIEQLANPKDAYTAPRTLSPRSLSARPTLSKGELSDLFPPRLPVALKASLEFCIAKFQATSTQETL